MNTYKNNSSTSLKSSSSFGKKEKRHSWRDKIFITNYDEGPDFEDTADSISLASYKTAHSRGVISTKSTESVNSNFETKSMVTAMSEESLNFNVNDDDRAITPTDATEFKSKWKKKNSLKKENARLQHQIIKLKEDRQRWTLLNKDSIVSSHKCEYNQVANEIWEERLMETENLLHDYREENSILKCELQDIKENLVEQKFEALKAINDQLTSKNTELLQSIQDLQHEIEEMQDQFREKEIDEFRELQRELEQYAKNCRILQFKYRKSERQCEQFKSEKNFLTTKLSEFQQITDTINLSDDGENFTSVGINNESNKKKVNNDLRIRNLKSELKVAKEVSIRLHNELEVAEDIRYKHEDEIFYYQEKVRELQTQNKWRETKNKYEKSKRHSQELSDASLNSVETSKELQDVLERETDLRDQLKFTEENLRRTQLRLKDLENENEELMNKLLNISERNNISSQNEAKSQLTKKHRLLMLRSDSNSQDKLNDQVLSVEKTLELSTVSSLLANYKKFCKNLINFENKDGTSFAQLEKDILILLTNIDNLEQKNTESPPQFQISQILSSLSQTIFDKNESKGLTIELKKEQEQQKKLQNELTEYKQLIAKSDNKKLNALVFKVEALNNQLSLLKDRCQTIHQKFVDDANIDFKYANKLQSRCDLLEKQLSVLQAKETLKISDCKNVLCNKKVSTDDIEQCCAILASVDAQTNRILKQLEKMETGQKDERRRSLNKDNFVFITSDWSNIIIELKMLRKLLNTYKILNKKTIPDNESGNNNINEQSTNYNPTQNKQDDKILNSLCKDCFVKNTAIELQIQEISFYKKKTKELTNQVLQTDNRWKSEIEKQDIAHKTQVQKLEHDLANLQTSLQKQTQLSDLHSVKLEEKCKLMDETNIKFRKLTIEINEKLKIIENLEKEQKSFKEWEIKYRKIESLYEKEKQKFLSDKTRMKADTNSLKKRTDEALFELTRLRDGHQRREILWNQERLKLEQEIIKIKCNAHKNLNQKNLNKAKNHVINIPICTVNYRTAAVAAAAAESKIDNIDCIQTNQLKQRVFLLEKKNEELEVQLQKAKRQNCAINVEFKKDKQECDQEKNKLTHKIRQNNKIQNVELNDLQEKSLYCINIIEENDKLLKIQSNEKKECNNCIVENARNAAENVQKQYVEYQKFCNKEVNRLKDKIKELSDQLVFKENKFQKKEKDFQDDARQTGLADPKRFKQIIQNIEERNITRRYIILSIIKQINSILEKKSSTMCEKNDCDVILLVNIINQLNILKEDDRTLQCPTATGETLSEADTTALSDTVSRSSISVRSIPIPETRDFFINREIPTYGYGRSCSVDSNTAWESRLSNYTNRSVSPIKQTLQNDLNQNIICKRKEFAENQKTKAISILTNDTVPYDHYNKTTISSSMNSKSSPITNWHFKSMQNAGALILFDNNLNKFLDETTTHSRMSSTGTNVLYKIRRKELTNNANLSVRSIAQAFESYGTNDNKSTKHKRLNTSQLKNFFSMQKSRSVDHEATQDNHRPLYLPKTLSTLNYQTMSKKMQNSNNMVNSSFSTLSRDGRNSFKNISSKIVERVRRSLSRNSREIKD